MYADWVGILLIILYGLAFSGSCVVQVGHGEIGGVVVLGLGLQPCSESMVSVWILLILFPSRYR